MKVAIAGSSGLIGSGLVPALRTSGHEVIRLVRRSGAGRGEVSWDPAGGRLDHGDLEGVEAIVNLAGAGIGDKRWTPERKREVVESRTSATRLLAEAAAALPGKPALLNGSAVGFYGHDRGDAVQDESSPKGTGFLADVVEAWEAAAKPAVDGGVRVVFLRTGLVQSAAGGVLAKQLLPFKLGIGGRLGSGRQHVPWISLADEVAGIERCLTDASLSGPVNLVAPRSVTNLEYTKALGRALHRPTLLPIPTLPIKAALGAEFVQEALLGGQHVKPGKLLAAGFRFRHETIDDALADIL